MISAQQHCSAIAILLATSNVFAVCQESTIVKMIDAGFKPDYIMAICPVTTTAPPATQPAKAGSGSGSGTRSPNKADAAKSTSVSQSDTAPGVTTTPQDTTKPSTAGSSDAAKAGGQALADAAVGNQTGGAGGKAANPNAFSGSPPNVLMGTVKARVRIPGFSKAGQNEPDVFAPYNSRFTVTSDVIDKATGEEKLYVRFEKSDKGTTTSDGKNTPKDIDQYSQYVVNRNTLDNYDHVYYGWTYGVLTAPYKFQLSNRSLGGSATVGPYVGSILAYSENMSAKLVFSAGLASVPVASSQAGSTATTNKAALSFSTGLLWTLNKQFEMGFLLGADVVGPNSQYQYNGKPWLALDIGYKFSN